MFSALGIVLIFEEQWYLILQIMSIHRIYNTLYSYSLKRIPVCLLHFFSHTTPSFPEMGGVSHLPWLQNPPHTNFHAKPIGVVSSLQKSETHYTYIYIIQKELFFQAFYVTNFTSNNIHVQSQPFCNYHSCFQILRQVFHIVSGTWLSQKTLDSKKNINCSALSCKYNTCNHFASITTLCLNNMVSKSYRYTFRVFQKLSPYSSIT